MGNAVCTLFWAGHQVCNSCVSIDAGIHNIVSITSWESWDCLKRCYSAACRCLLAHVCMSARERACGLAGGHVGWRAGVLAYTFALQDSMGWQEHATLSPYFE